MAQGLHLFRQRPSPFLRIARQDPFLAAGAVLIAVFLVMLVYAALVYLLGLPG